MHDGATPRPRQIEQRRFKRASTLFAGRLDDGARQVEVVILDDGARQVEVVILDVSVNGAKVRLPDGHSSGGSVRLTIERFGTFAAEVMWQRDNRLGLRFTDAPEWIARTLPKPFAARISDAPGRPSPARAPGAGASAGSTKEHATHDET